MKNQQRAYQEKDYNFQEVTKALGLDYDQLKKSGEIDRVLRSGVGSALTVRVQGKDEVNGRKLTFETTARMSLGIDKDGRRVIQPILKSADLQLDTYRNIRLTQDQQKQLREGKTVILKEPNTEREILAKVDKSLNKIAGWKKSSVLIPQELGNQKIGTAKLEPAQQAALKRGETISLEINGQQLKAQVDPVERQIRVTKPLEQKIEKSLEVQPKQPKLKL